MKLYCIPFSGGNAYSYLAFKKQLVANIRFVTLELPGHGTRISEPLLHTIDEMTDDLLRQIELNQHDDYVLFGHSLGALLAFLMCRKISKAGKPLPSMLFVSGQSAPSLIKPDERYLLPDKQFVEVLREMEGTPNELLSEKQFLDFFLPVIKADFQALANFRYHPENPLEVPIVVLAGKQEKFRFEEVERWQVETTNKTEFYWFEGGHFFINDHATEICRLVEEKCSFIKT